MENQDFVAKNGIVREIWGNGDTILFIFAGAAAEFALNKAVDWLYFTGKLPKDPLGRLFSTVAYAREIIFSNEKSALKAIDSMSAIHANVERQRGMSIPDWAYRDVLFMLIDYSIRSFELMERKLDDHEKQEVFEVFLKVGTRMGLTGLPQTFPDYNAMRQKHLIENMQYSRYTADLFLQYRKHLGLIRYRILLESQTMIVPTEVRKLLNFRKLSFIEPLIFLYKFTRAIHADRLLKKAIMPKEYLTQIQALDYKPGKCPYPRLKGRNVILFGRSKVFAPFSNHHGVKPSGNDISRSFRCGCRGLHRFDCNPGNDDGNTH